jgi:hypothetical protein
MDLFAVDTWRPKADFRRSSAGPNKEHAIMVRETEATMRPAPQDNQLMSKHRVLGFRP